MQINIESPTVDVKIEVKPLHLFWPVPRDRMTDKMQKREARSQVMRAINAWSYEGQ